MEKFLYKVSAPRSDMVFYPSTFWHTLDWESSTTRYREGYIEDEVLFAGDFDEVNIHLFPRVRTVRVRSKDADASVLRSYGIECYPGKTAYLFLEKSYEEEVDSFHPTIFKFNSHGFQHVRKGEYVSWRPQRAISYETIKIIDAVKRWDVQACYVDDLNTLIGWLVGEDIYFDEQT